MASLALLFKNCLLRLCATALAASCIVAAADAATFSVKRGLNLDLWTTWPDESRWGDESVILPFPEWRRTLDRSGLEALKADGFDFLRMPVDPSVFLSTKTEELRDRLFDSVLESVKLVNAAGLKVVMDLHLIHAGSNRSIGMGQVMDDPALFDAYVDVVRKMARRLSAQDPSLVAFELMNEPTIACDAGGDWPDRLNRLYAAARSSATRLTLVLSGACWGTAEGLAALDPRTIPDDNVLWSFHSYAPFLLTHQGATWAGDFIQYVTGIPFPPYDVPKSEMEAILAAIRTKIEAEAPWTRRSGMLAYLDEEFDKVDTQEELQAVIDAPFAAVEAWAKAHGVAPCNIILGEFGMIRQEYGNDYVMPPGSRAAYVSEVIGLAEKHGFAWSMWSYGGAFGVVEEFDNRPAEPAVLDTVRALPPRS